MTSSESVLSASLCEEIRLNSDISARSSAKSENMSEDCTFKDKSSWISREISLTEVTLESTLKETGYKHAVHCMVYAKWDNSHVLGAYLPRAAILMQLRFDGCIGFPGGLIDEQMTGIPLELAEQRCIDAVSREMVEEMNLDLSQHVITKNEYICTFRHPSEKLFSHFYCHEITMDGIREVERMTLMAKDFGSEVMGVFRVPLYTMHDGFRGFPAFLNHNFILCSRQQLLRALEEKKILTKSQLQEAIEASQNVRASQI